MENMSIIYDVLLEYQAEIVLNEAMGSFAKLCLYAAIDGALEKGDQATFLLLTNEMKSLQSG